MIAALLVAALFQTAMPSVRTLDQGAASGIDAPRQVVARTAAEWQALWRQHAPDKPVPAVDFAREMVVGVFLGERPTPGYRVDVSSLRVEGDALVVVYRETRPGRDRIAAQVLTSPYHLTAVPAHAGTVRFEQAGN